MGKTSDEAPSDQEQPEGARDYTTLPNVPNGYTIRFRFHQAKNLPMADYASMTSDPYLCAILVTSTPPRHEGDPPLSLRVPTVHKSVEPTFDCEWTVANIPADGFQLKVRVYDEDMANQDDR